MEEKGGKEKRGMQKGSPHFTTIKGGDPDNHRLPWLKSKGMDFWGEDREKRYLVKHTHKRESGPSERRGRKGLTA